MVVVGVGFFLPFRVEVEIGSVLTRTCTCVCACRSMMYGSKLTSPPAVTHASTHLASKNTIGRW